MAPMKRQALLGIAQPHGKGGIEHGKHEVGIFPAIGVNGGFVKTAPIHIKLRLSSCSCHRAIVGMWWDISSANASGLRPPPSAVPG
jgi:hypothetical protein